MDVLSPSSWTYLENDVQPESAPLRAKSDVNTQTICDDKESSVSVQCLINTSNVLWAVRHPFFTVTKETVGVTDVTDLRLTEAGNPRTRMYEEDEGDRAWSDRLNSITRIDSACDVAYAPSIMRIPVGSRFAFDPERVVEVHNGLLFAWCQVGGGNVTSSCWVLVGLKFRYVPPRSLGVADQILKMTCDLFGMKDSSTKKKRSKAKGYPNHPKLTVYAVGMDDQKSMEDYVPHLASDCGDASSK